MQHPTFIMKKYLVFLTCLLTGIWSYGQTTMLNSKAKEELKQWDEQHFSPKVTPPFSFVYGGEKSSDLIGNWHYSVKKIKSSDPNYTKTIYTYSDKRTGLVLECEALRYTAFPAIEWYLTLKNSGKNDTPILEAIQALNTILPSNGALHWSNGGVASFDDFAPQDKQFAKEGESLHLQPGGGRSSSSVLPFFNAQGTQGGVMVGIGWTGEWAVDFTSVKNGLSCQAGMAKTHLLLHPGEEIRTPKVLLLFYEGDQWSGQNAFRRFILACHRPKINGKPLPPTITWGVFGTTPAEVHQYNIDKIIAHKLPLDYYWIDAGWYKGEGNWYQATGTWEENLSLYPNGLKSISNQLEKAGTHLMVWFEPERVHTGTAWYKEHPDWLLNQGNFESSLMNMGNPVVRKFVTDNIASDIRKFGLSTGCYRQDFNIEPYNIWISNDAPDRQGYTEAKYVEGLYAYWDALQREFPGMIIDNCAGGGRRLDLETTGRATPFWRTDGPRDPVAHQCHSYGLMQWLPLSATSEDREGDDYDFRSGMSSCLCINWLHSGDGAWWKIPDDFPFDWAQKAVKQYLSVRDYYLDDYYPLSPYSKNQDVWMAWQLNSPEKGEGMIQAFRREQSICTAACVKLRGLQPDATYSLVDIDTGTTQQMSGKDLMEKGLSIVINKQPGAAIITYRKQP